MENIEQDYQEAGTVVDGVYIPPKPENAVGAGAPAKGKAKNIAGVEGLTGKRAGIAAAIALAVAVGSAAIIANTVGFPAVSAGGADSAAVEEAFEDAGIEAVEVARAESGLTITRCAVAGTGEDGSAVYPVRITNPTGAAVIARASTWESNSTEITVLLECDVAANSSKQTTLTVAPQYATNAYGVIEIVDAESGEVVEEAPAIL